jgi:leucyl/phenylalanyl-tRNA--protein transferase
MISLQKLDAETAFPDAKQALQDPNGLLAFGGDLSVDRLLQAYNQGIFPWFSEGEPILWWSPDPRGVVYVANYTPHKSLKKHIRKNAFKITVNYAFDTVIKHCAHVPRMDQGTWITNKMLTAYKKLHQAGYAHSIEVWDKEALIGGLYGVFVRNTFCGESMFSLQSNASKVAFHYLIEFLQQHHVPWVDCQMQNRHLASLGCISISRADFLAQLASQPQVNNVFWKASVLVE